MLLAVTGVLLTLPAAVVTTCSRTGRLRSLAVYFQSSPGSSSPLWLMSPTLKADQDGVG